MCRGPRENKHRYCRECQASYMREWRAAGGGELDEEGRRRMIARSIANVAQARGKLIPEPCEVCGEAEVEKHHDDYSEPLLVRWFCRLHHREHHRFHVEPLN